MAFEYGKFKEGDRMFWHFGAGDKKITDGEPCGHPGCLQHVSHPCEGCGRTGGREPKDATK